MAKVLKCSANVSRCGVTIPPRTNDARRARGTPWTALSVAMHCPTAYEIANMPAQIEIHGFRLCPFAWRTRLAAREKGVNFDWLPADASEPDPRSREHNPNRRSPLLRHGDFIIADSLVIIQYIDEAFEGPALQPGDAQGRARMRLSIADLSSIMIDGRKELDDESRARAKAALGNLDAKLANGADWLGGDSPTLADIPIWPFMSILEFRGGLALDGLPRATAYWERVRSRDSYKATNPYTG